MIDWTRCLRRAAIVTLCVSAMGCTTMEVDTAPADRFASKGYETFSWRAEIPAGVPQSMESLYRLAATVRETVAAELEKKGYRYQDSGGDFLVTYAFGARLEGGDIPVTPEFGPNTSVINRSPDPAVMALGNAVGGWLGARLTLEGGERVIRWVVVFSIAGMMVKLIWFP